MNRPAGFASGVVILVSMMASACTPTAPTPIVEPPPPSALIFTAAATFTGTIGTPFFHSFCKPDLSDSNASLCQSGATNPTGGTPPYTFQLGAGTGFQPMGLSLGLNGILKGTPTVAGQNTFSVCAVDLARRSVCRNVTMTIRPAVGDVAIALGFCQRSATPLPGWLNCPGTITMIVNATVQSGFLAIILPYPDSGAFYFGEIPVPVGTSPGHVTVNIRNPYVRGCPVEPYRTTLTVYDGRSGTGTGPVIDRVEVELSGCTS